MTCAYIRTDNKQIPKRPSNPFLNFYLEEGGGGGEGGRDRGGGWGAVKGGGGEARGEGGGGGPLSSLDQIPLKNVGDGTNRVKIPKNPKTKTKM